MEQKGFLGFASRLNFGIREKLHGWVLLTITQNIIYERK